MSCICLTPRICVKSSKSARAHTHILSLTHTHTLTLTHTWPQDEDYELQLRAYQQQYEQLRTNFEERQRTLEAQVGPAAYDLKIQCHNLAIN